MLITSQNRYFLMFYSLMKDFFSSSADLMLHDLKLALRKKGGKSGCQFYHQNHRLAKVPPPHSIFKLALIEITNSKED